MGDMGLEIVGDLPTSDRAGHEEQGSVDLAGLVLELGVGGPRAMLVAGRLFDAFAPQFLGFLMRQGLSEADSDDVVQGVFEKILRDPGRLVAVRNLRGYMWQMLRNAHVDFIRARARGPSYLPPLELPDVPVCQTSMEHQAYLECVEGAWQCFKSQLPDKATAIELVASGGLSGQELALALGRTYGAAREYLSQCRKALRTVILMRCGEQPAEMED